MFTKPQAQYLLDLIFKQPIQLTMGDVAKGLRFSPDVAAIIVALQNIINPPKPAAPAPASPAKNSKPSGKTNKGPAGAKPDGGSPKASNPKS